MVFEQNLQNALLTQYQEKTFIDKLLAKEDATRVKELVRQSKLKREDLLELLYLLSGTEAKLLNYSDWDRYIILKYFVWIRDFVKVAENIYDYEDDLIKKTKTCSKCRKLLEKGCNCINPIPFQALTPRTKQLFYNAERNIEHNAKFLIDLYFNIARTSLSVKAVAFTEMLKNKYEVSYPYGTGQMPIQEPKKGLFHMKN